MELIVGKQTRIPMPYTHVFCDVIQKPEWRACEIKQMFFEYFGCIRGWWVIEEFIYTKWRADILLDNGKQISEVEIKTSKADLKNDLTHKSDKHLAMSYSYKRNPPNLFYFCVPIYLLETAMELLRDYPKYGLFVVEKTPTGLNGWSAALTKVKPAKPLSKAYSPIPHEVYARRYMQTKAYKGDS